MNLIASTLITLLTTISPIQSHSWLDCWGPSEINYSGHNQYYGDEFYHEACRGFPRGYPGRMNRWINDIYTHQLVGRKPDGLVCSPISQSTKNYTSEFYMGKAQAGSSIKLWWEADNHFNPGPTYVHVYSSQKSNDDLTKYSQLNKDTLLWSHVFATEQNCMDKSPNALCWGHMKVPNVAPGNYQFVWQWVWDQNPVGEEYLTCFDLEITGGNVQPQALSQTTTVAPAPSPAPATTPAPVPAPTNNVIPQKGYDAKPDISVAPAPAPTQPPVVQPTSAPASTIHKGKCHRKKVKQH